ncbi:MAG: hypothetical protein NWE94_04835 [Candidatus Bathyarchaeota archaeon]|nr:hypothetical protein [Candidatus Bathyarchaeota archaeon]
MYSPSNTTYYERNIWVNFTIIQPTSWHQDNFSLVSIQQVSYQLDDTVPEHVGFPNLTNNQYLALLKELPDGKHTLQIDVLTYSYYKQRENWIFTETYTMNTRLTIDFTVNAEPTPSPSASPSPTLSPSPLPNQKEPFPTTLVIAISAMIAIITLSAIVYLKKRRH